jgi:NAD(P)H-flavin reductase
MLSKLWFPILCVALYAKAASGYAARFGTFRTSQLSSRRAGRGAGLWMNAPDTAGWGSVKVLNNVKEAEGLRTIDVEVSTEAAESYLTPGQYVQMKSGESKPGFYAIASAPSKENNRFTFLIKETENNAAITGCAEGASLEMSSPQGKGFQITGSFDQYQFEYPVSNVLLMACGSGLAPIAAAIESEILSLNKVGFNSLYPRKASLYIGARSEDHIPFKSKFDAWKELGVDVIPVLSQPGDGWQGKKGYIQDALREDSLQIPKNSGALLCGQRPMVEDVKSYLLESGVFEGRILLNF